MKYLGCAYYPEYWGPERVELDAMLMKEAGINLVRIGEFAWSRMEPEDGSFTLDWLHGCVETLGKFGISVLMCTPTATPPAWLTTTYPNTCLVHADGRRAEHGRRRHYCTTSDTYRRFSARITDFLSQEMSQHANVAAWQLDNEFGPEMSWCHCENCQARFQAWLKKRYASIQELNRVWGTGFWSMDYSDWRQVRLGSDPGLYPSRLLDSKRFWSDSMISFALQQAEIIRRNHPQALVTTNGMGPIFQPIDYYEMFGKLDVACDDLYFDIATLDADAAAMNVFRSLKPGRRYWITETGCGALDHNRPPHPDQFRAWAWSSLAHGAEAHLVFRWRTCLSGQEQELQGILEHSGSPRHRYQAVQKCFLELKYLWDEFKDLPLPEAPVAIVQDYQTLWAYESSRVGADVNYLGLVYRLHKALYDRNIVADFIPPERALHGYRLVILPSTVIISPGFATRLADFVSSGGVLLAVGQIGMRDVNNNYLPYPGPDHLQELLGINIEGGMYLGSFVAPDEALWAPTPRRGQVEVKVSGNLGGKPVEGKASAWAADLTFNGGDVLLNFAGDTYAGQPAVVQRRHGEGFAIYAGALRLDDELSNALLEYCLSNASVQPGPSTPEYVEVIRRGEVTFAINHTSQPVRVELGGSGKALVGVFQDGVAELGPYGVCAVKAEV
jgi:beta-galactosidase